MLHWFQFLCQSFWFTIRNYDYKIKEGYLLDVTSLLFWLISGKKISLQNCTDMGCLPSFDRRTLAGKLGFSDGNFEASMVSLHLIYVIRVWSCKAGMMLCTEMKKGRVK